MYQFTKEVKTRALLVKFVQQHRADFGEPVNKYVCLCSMHLEENCFTTVFNESTKHLNLDLTNISFKNKCSLQPRPNHNLCDNFSFIDKGNTSFKSPSKRLRD